jgi:hypothetical protein
MAISLIDKIKQKNGLTFPLVDHIDINGRITGWQNPVKKIFADIASITGLVAGDTFIVRNTTGEWAQYTGKDIYARDAAAATNGIYILGEAIDAEAEPIYLVTAPEAGMILFDKDTVALKRYGGMPAQWLDLTTGGGSVEGKTLRYEGVIIVDTSETVSQNYDPSTNELEIEYEIQAGDVVKIWVNGLKYQATVNPAYSYNAGDVYVTWIKNNAGFDLESGDEVIIEIFK